MISVFPTMIFLPAVIALTQAGQAELLCTAGPANTPQTIGVTNCDNRIYLTNVQIGSTNAAMGLAIDTSISQVWVSVSNSTYQANDSESYVPGTEQVTICVDYFDLCKNAQQTCVSTIDGSDQLALPGTGISVFTQVVFIQSQQLTNMPAEVSGVIGLGYQGNNLFDTAFQQQQISSAVFAVSLASESSPQPSVILYNTVPETLQTGSLYARLLDSNWWELELLRVSADSEDFTHLSAKSIKLDSMAPTCVLNTGLYEHLVFRYFSGCANLTTSPICDCKANQSWPTLSFMLAGVEVYLEPEQYSTVTVSGTCAIALSKGQTEQIFLGQAFFRAYTLTFDKLAHRIGFHGRTSPVQLLGASNSLSFYFECLLLVVLIILCIITTVLLQKVRVVKHLKPTFRSSQLSLAFLESPR